jgi:hypothetical protein
VTDPDMTAASAAPAIPYGGAPSKTSASPRLGRIAMIAAIALFVGSITI